jgi:DNA-binding winged helix-turn-helix (wHTH) protein
MPTAEEGFMAADGVRQSPLQFDLFELDPSGCELRRRGVPVDLPPQALRVLVLLISRPNELLARTEIKEALWPGQSYGDFDSRLNFSVKKLREALGDDAERPRYVQTVRNAGYRFIASVREPQPVFSGVLSSDSADSPHNPGSSGDGQEFTRTTMLATSRNRFGRQGFLLAVAAFVLIAIGAMGVLGLQQRDAGHIPYGEPSVRMKPADGELRIVFVSAIVPLARQKIVIRGRGFGLHVPYAHTDSPYLAIRDQTRDWAAGRMIPQNWDEVMVDVESWTDNEIVISGFSGEYGRRGWQLAVGDDLEIAVWNPQSEAGPAIFHTRVIAAEAAK